MTSPVRATINEHHCRNQIHLIVISKPSGAPSKNWLFREAILCLFTHIAKNLIPTEFCKLFELVLSFFSKTTDLPP